MQPSARELQSSSLLPAREALLTSWLLFPARRSLPSTPPGEPPSPAQESEICELHALGAGAQGVN